ncbi:MAG: hypothetical protein ACRD36_09115, partial [Candidatus Acidiferrum sp.]
MRTAWLSGIALLVSVLPAFAQSTGGIGGAAGSSGQLGGLGGSSLGGGIGGSSGSFLGTGGLGSSSSLTCSNGSFLGSQTGGTARSGQGAQSIGSTSPFGAYYGNPLSLGIPSSNGTLITSPTFGQLLYTISNTTPNSLAGGTGTSGGGVATIATATQAPFSANSMGLRRAPAYTTSL